MVWNPFRVHYDEQKVARPAPEQFVTYGVKHMKIWTLAVDEEGLEFYQFECAKFSGKTEVRGSFQPRRDAQVVLAGFGRFWQVGDAGA